MSDQGGNPLAARIQSCATPSKGKNAQNRYKENDQGMRRERGTDQSCHTVRPIGFQWYPWVKTALERLVALLLLIPAGPVILLAACLVKLTSKGPAFYTQTRVGKGGKPFTIYKLRTMINKCESLTGPRWSVPGDPRVTRVGQFLRLTHLDELPQLLNVLKGDMALIGPRPERPEFVPELELAFPCYRQRLNVRPGVTGLAQVQLPADTDLGSVEAKLAYDLYYIQSLSPWMDLKILAGTILYTLGASYGVVRWLIRLPQQELIQQRARPFLEQGRAQSRSTREAA